MRNWVWRFALYAGGAYVAPPWPPGSFDLVFSPPAVSRAGGEESSITNPSRQRFGNRRRRKHDSVADQCGAFLSGRWHAVPAGSAYGLVPAWVWVHSLAHADEPELERLANRKVMRRHDPLAFLSYLAKEVLLYVDDPRWSLERIQDEILRPLELALILGHLDGVDFATLANGVVRAVQNPSKSAPTSTTVREHRPVDGLRGHGALT